MSAVLLWMGCGEGPEAESPEALGGVEQEVACTETDPVSTGSTGLVGSVCAGPWEYELKCYNSSQTSNCTVASYNTSTCCRVPENGQQGTDRTTRYFTTTVTGVEQRTLECSEYVNGQKTTTRKTASAGLIGGGGEDENLPPPNCYWVTEMNYESPCAQAAAHEKNAIPEAYRSPVTYNSSVVSINYSNNTATCNYTLYNYPVYNRAIHSSCTASSWDSGQCTDYNKPVYNWCRAPAHGEALASQCGQVKLYSATGKTRADVDADAQALYNQRQANIAAPAQLSSSPQHYKVLPECTTTEPMPMGDSVQAQAKYERLKYWHGRVDTLPAGAPQTGVDRAALKSQLHRRMKQVFELRASWLTPAQQDHAMDLYWLAPADRPLCGLTWTPPAVTTACTTSRAALDGSITMCQRMLEATAVSGKATNVTAALLKECATLAQQVKPLSNDCSFTAYRDALRQVNMGLLARNVSTLTTTLGTPERESELREKLSYIGQWYAQGRAHLYPAGAPDPSLFKDSSTLLKSFWNSAYLNTDLAGTPSAFTTPEEAEAFRKKVLADGLVADRQVLKAAFSKDANGVLPLRNAPLLYVVGDTLKGMNERLKDVSRLHDMSCRFKTCNNAPTATSQLWNLLAAIDDSAALLTAKNAAVNVDPAWVETKDALGTVTASGPFALMQANHIAFQDAVKDALGLASSTPYTPALLSGASVEELPAPAQGVAALLKDAQVRAASYAQDGLFIPTQRNLLKVGLDRAKQTDIQTQLTTITQQLTTEVDSYKASRLTLVNGLLAQLKNQSDIQNLNSRAQQLAEQTAELSKDLNGLRISHAVDEARYGDFMKGFEALVPAIETAGQNMLKSEVSLNVNAKDDTRFTTPGSEDLRTAWVQENGVAFSQVAAAGETLNLEVSGQWAPSCALTKVDLPGTKPLVRSSPTAGPILTGPEGYSFTETDSEYRAESNQTVTTNGKYENWSWGAKICAGLNFMMPLAETGIGALFSLVGKVEGCFGYDAGRTWSQNKSRTSSDGNESRSTFSMARGVRSSATPFPDQPVGALLLVQMPPDGASGSSYARGDRYSVQVVQAPYTSVLVDRASRYYLVVNDIMDTVACPTASVSSSPLAVRMTRLVSVSEASKQMARAMLATQVQLQPTIDAYIAQGRLLPSQASHIRNTAYQKLFAECGCTNVSSFPESLQNLYETWISKEIVDVEREVELVQIERQIRALVLELRNLKLDAENASAQARLLALAPAWSLRNLDGKQLRMRLDALDQVMGDWLAPVVDLRHPEVRTQFTTAERDNLDDLTELDPLSTTLDMVALATEAKEAAEAVEQRLRLVRTSTPPVSPTDLVISIPRSSAITTNWNRVDDETATAVWNAINTNQDVTVTLKPEYIYNWGTRFLSCNFSAPVISSIAVYVATNQTASFPLFTVPVVFSPEMTFPTTGGLRQYDFSNALYLGPQAEAMVGSSTSAHTTMKSYWDGGKLVATGLSPFTSLHLDLKALRAHKDLNGNPSNPLLNPSVRELIIGLRLEYRQEGSNATLPGVPLCY